MVGIAVALGSLVILPPQGVAKSTYAQAKSIHCIDPPIFSFSSLPVFPYSAFPSLSSQWHSHHSLEELIDFLLFQGLLVTFWEMEEGLTQSGRCAGFIQPRHACHWESEGCKDSRNPRYEWVGAGEVGPEGQDKYLRPFFGWSSL